MWFSLCEWITQGGGILHHKKFEFSELSSTTTDPTSPDSASKDAITIVAAADKPPQIHQCHQTEAAADLQSTGHGQGEQRRRRRHWGRRHCGWISGDTGDRVVPLHSEDNRVRAPTRARRVYWGTRRSELSGGGGHCCMVALHQGQNGLGPPQRALRPLGSCWGPLLSLILGYHPCVWVAVFWAGISSRPAPYWSMLWLICSPIWFWFCKYPCI